VLRRLFCLCVVGEMMPCDSVSWRDVSAMLARDLSPDDSENALSRLMPTCRGSLERFPRPTRVTHRARSFKRRSWCRRIARFDCRDVTVRSITHDRDGWWLKARGVRLPSTARGNIQFSKIPPGRNRPARSHIDTYGLPTFTLASSTRKPASFKVRSRFVQGSLAVR
jgi:hypothetical protein